MTQFLGFNKRVIRQCACSKSRPGTDHSRLLFLTFAISLESHSIEFRRYLDPELGSRISGVSGRNKLDGVVIILARVEFVRNSEREMKFGSVLIWTGRPPSI